MYHRKRISSDMLLLVLLVVRLRLDADLSHTHRWNREPESREVHLGSSSAYAQISLYTPPASNRYPHPKSLEFNELDEASTLFNRLNYFNSVRDRRSNLIAYYASSPSAQNIGPSVEPANSDGTAIEPTSEAAVHTVPGEEHESRTDSTSENEMAVSVGIQDLSPEDMDLIEILWKQDIDLGVSREAYDSRTSLDVEKYKELEYPKENEFFTQTEIKESNENDVADALENLNYTIDSETGEYILDELSALNEEQISEDQLLKNNVLGALREDSYLPLNQNVSFSNFTNLFPADEFQQLLPDDLSADSDYLLSQIEDLEKELSNFDCFEAVESENNLTTGEIFPNVEDCWPDSSPVLPLLALSNNHEGPYVNLPPQPVNGYQTFNNINSIPIPTSMQPRAAESFSNMLNTESLEMPHNVETFQPVASIAGPSSIGCAVAESIATLTNDTDPVPNSSIIGTSYNSDFPDILYTNQTIAVPHNELLTTDFLWDDLQLVNLTSDGNKMTSTEDRVDTSSDSVSLTSGRVPSISDCAEWIDSCSESSSHYGEKDERSSNNSLSTHSHNIGPFPHSQNFEMFTPVSSKRQRHLENSNDKEKRNISESSFKPGNNFDQQYFASKNSLHDISRHSACASATFGDSVSSKFDFSLSRPPTASCSNFLQHNHSYHLPFMNSNSHSKPIVRDKSKSLSEEEANNKDEKRAKELKIPISIDDIINLAIDEYNERLSKYELTDAQLTLIRDIRRRGKNKVAAQNCRKRKMDQICTLQQDLDFLRSERLQLKSKQNFLFKQKHHIDDKYAQLYQVIMQSTNCKPPGASDSISLLDNTDASVPSDAFMLDDSSDASKGARAKRKK